jgi:hypothetical protein
MRAHFFCPRVRAKKPGFPGVPPLSQPPGFYAVWELRQFPPAWF